MSLENNIYYRLCTATSDDKEMCLQNNCKMISHIIFYPFISQVFLEAASNLLWNEAGSEFLNNSYFPLSNPLK